MKKPANAHDVLDFSVAVIELYFRIEALAQAVGGFTNAGGEWGVLRTLIEEEPATVPDIARSRPVSRQHCQTIVNALAAQGYVEFIDNPRHKRSPLVRITKKGRAQFEAMSKTFLAAAKRYAPAFDAKDIADATALLRKAREVLVV